MPNCLSWVLIVVLSAALLALDPFLSHAAGFTTEGFLPRAEGSLQGCGRFRG